MAIKTQSSLTLRLDQISRGLVVLSAVSALVVSVWLFAAVYPPLRAVSVFVALGFYACARAFPAVATGAAMFLAASHPVLVRQVTGIFDPTYGGLWIAAVVGIALASGLTRPWSLPPIWRLPIALWALAIAFSWPILAAREADFSFWALGELRSAVTGQGTSIPGQVAWIAGVAGMSLTGMLWIDALFRVYSPAPIERFERLVLWPALGGILCSAAVALYQMTADVTFLNPTVYGVMGRASGLALDANVAGVLAAVCMPAVLVATRRCRFPWVVVATAAALAALAAVWASGSRTALVAAACSGIGCGWFLLSSIKSKRVTAGIIASAVIGVLLGVGLIRSSTITTSPIARIRTAYERIAEEGGLFRFLSDRDGYGRAATRIIEEHPLVGVGVGAFHALALDYIFETAPSQGASADNAQNWLRHQLAELGVLGSIGCLFFVGVLLVLLFTPGFGASASAAVAIASAIVGVGFASFLGMPTQHSSALIVLWTLIYWYARLRGSRDSSADVRTWHWVVILVLAVGYGTTTYLEARADLRVPHRAMRFGWHYFVGYYGLDTPDQGGPFRWTKMRAKAAIPTPPGYLKLNYWVHHGDVTSNPVRVRFWRDGTLVIDETVADQKGRTAYLFVRSRHGGVVIESDVSRVWVPPHETPKRELGVAVADWQIVTRPPPDARIIE